MSRSKRRHKPTLIKWRQKLSYKFTNPLTKKFTTPEIIDTNRISKTSYSREDTKEACRELYKNPFTDVYGGMSSQNAKTGELGNAIYYVGIIDLLQQYDRQKKLEHFLKSQIDDPEVISSVNPDIYSKRFNMFLSQKVQ